MINSIFAIIVLVILGKVSKDTIGSKSKANGFATFLYFVLSVVVGVIFYKTYQVGINENTITIQKYMGTENENGKCLDSTIVEIFHRMNLDNTKDILEHADYINRGGFRVNIVAPKTSKEHNCITKRDTTKLTKLFLTYNFLEQFRKLHNSGSITIPDSNAIWPVLDKMKEQLFVYRPKVKELLIEYEKKNSIKIAKTDLDLMNDALDYILNDYRYLFQVSYTTSKNQTIFPIETYSNSKYQLFPTTKNIICMEGKQMVDSISHLRIRRSDGDYLLDSKYLEAFNLRNTPTYTYWIGDDNSYFSSSKENDNSRDIMLSVRNCDSLFNHMNFLTASDLSQKIYEVIINTEVPLKGLIITFDVPIDITGIYPTPDETSMLHILYRDKNKLKYIEKSKIKFHAKLPTFENMQLIRSLILTTILTAIVSLFCSNLYLCILSIVNRCLRRKKNEENPPLSGKEKYLHWLNISLGSILLTILLVFYLLYAFNKTISINEVDENNLIIGYSTLIILILLATLAINRVFRKENNKS